MRWGFHHAASRADRPRPGPAVRGPSGPIQTSTRPHQRPPTAPPPLTLLAAAVLALVLALPAGEVHAQTMGQTACPDGVMQKGHSYLSVTDVKASEASRGGKTQASVVGGSSAISPRDIESLTEVIGSWPTDFSHADMAFMVRDENGPVHGGFWVSVGTVGWQGGTRDLALSTSPMTFHNLEGATKHVAQLIVSRLRHVSGGLGNRVVTNQFVSGVGAPISGNKPKPVLAQICFQTPALPS